MAAAPSQIRTTNDVVALCVELLRAVREQEFRSRASGGRATSVDRAWRAFRTDLDRHGPLVLFADAEGLREREDGPCLGRGRLDDLRTRLRERGLPWLGFDPGLDAPSYGALVSLLVASPEEVRRHGGAAGFLPEHGIGIRLPACDDAALPPDAEEKPEPAVPRAAEAVRADGDVTQPWLEASDLARAPVVPEPPAASVEPDDPFEGLRSCRDVAAYPRLANQTVREAIAADEAGDLAPFHRAASIFAEHAGRRSDLHEDAREMAGRALSELCSGRRLGDLIARATGADPHENRRATLVLLQLAGSVAPALLSAIDVQDDEQRREELLGITIALGRAATPALRRAMEGSSDARARVAARIAGEIRDERAVPALARLLDHRHEDVRGEAARALARVGDPSALEALSEGLTSSRDDVAALCAYCLGVTGRPEAAEALSGSLRDARRRRRLSLATAVVRSLGRLGREESVPELRRILEKRSWFRRQENQELKLQAVNALVQVPGDSARSALSEVASGTDMSLAVAARRALQNREEGGD